MENIISAEWIIPVDGNNSVLSEHSLVISNGKIIDILSSDIARAKYSNFPETKYKNKAITPGFINAHTHTPMVLLRGLGDKLPLDKWLEDCIWPAERELISKEFIQDGMQLGIAEMLLSGTTCFSEHYFLPEVSAEIVKQTGIRAMIGIGILDGVTDLIPRLSLAKELISWQEPNIKFAYAPHSPYMVSDQSFQAILNNCSSHPAPIHIHLHETNTEIAKSKKLYNKTPLERLNQLGIMDQHVIAIHMVHCNQNDLKILQTKPCHIVTCPDSNLKLSSGICNLNIYEQAGLNIAVGTDGAASNNDLDLLTEARSAGFLNKVLNRDPCLSNADQILEMLTINGAKALGMADKIGSLEIGKQADFITWDINNLNCFPRHNLVAQIIFAGNISQIKDVWVNGVCLLEDRTLTKLSMPELLEKAKHWEQKTSKYC